MQIKNSLFWRYFTISALILSVTAIIGILSTYYFVDQFKLKNEMGYLKRIALVFEKDAENLGIDEFELVQEIDEKYSGFLPRGLFVVAADGEIYSPMPLPPHIDSELLQSLPQEPLQPVLLSPTDHLIAVCLPSKHCLLRFIYPPGFKRQPWSFLFGPQPPPHRRYHHRPPLDIQTHHPRVFGMTPEGASVAIFLTYLIFGFILCILVCSLLFKKTAQSADHVLQELQSGNLKARFELQGSDGHSLLMAKFNSMADEIEKLFEALKRSEDARKHLLQDLAHDLKTPVASLHSLLESIRDHRANMKPEQMNEFLEASLAETKYFSRLVEDLLFISGVNDPRYSLNFERFDLLEAVEEEASLISNNRVKVVVSGEKPCPIHADPHLIKRLLRNGLDNAVSFASKQVQVVVKATENQWLLEIYDDGPGLRESELQSFGERSFSRKVDEAHQGRISIGLGAVIMKKIASLHEGSLSIENAKTDGTVQGAKLSIWLAREPS